MDEPVGKGGAVKAHRQSGCFKWCPLFIADEGSTLVFKSSILKMYEYTGQETYTMLRLWKHPEVGTLVLFPSWLEHYTEENNTENVLQ